ncbi:MAG: glutamate-1-semialdehyde 2,1-aminomutase [Planctomycetes bacterium]|nr:glutamate-1-semialdehyde 2,1-aminomutase [Planctomycetota bacterium]
MTLELLNDSSNPKSFINIADSVLVGGVNSPVRAFKSVGGKSFVVKEGKGSRIFDLEGHSYIDLVMSYGAIFLGHANPNVSKLINNQIGYGTSFGATSVPEIRLAELIASSSKSLEKIRFVNSGTEACMTAIRLARAFTGKGTILKFDGCYHGHSDSLLVSSGSGGLTYSKPTSEGLVDEITKYTISIPYNDPKILKEIVESKHSEIAAIIVEPIACNMGLVIPSDEFIKEIVSARKHNILVIFDEVITGFRFKFGLYQDILGVSADLTTMGKIIGGGFPLAAVGGRKEIMSLLSPEGPVYQAGTLSGNPVASAAGLAVLLELKNLNPYSQINAVTQLISKEFNQILNKRNLKDCQIAYYPGCITLFFTNNEIRTLNDVMTSNKEKFKSFFWAFLESGVFIPPSQFETWFITPALSDGDVNEIIKAFKKAVNLVK